MRIEPSLAGVLPLMIPTSVDLPAPFSPSRPTQRPGSICRSMASSTRLLP
jgi:hypothetical protein